MTFGIIDMIGADFVKNLPLYYTNQTDIPNYPEIEDYCGFEKYECSSIWAPRYGYPDETCPGYAQLICFSFHSLYIIVAFISSLTCCRRKIGNNP